MSKTSFVENAQRKQKETFPDVLKVIDSGIQDADVDKIRELPFSPENVHKALEEMDKKKNNPTLVRPDKFKDDHWKTL